MTHAFIGMSAAVDKALRSEAWQEMDFRRENVSQ